MVYEDMVAEYDIITTNQFMGILHLVTKKVWYGTYRVHMSETKASSPVY